MKAGFLPAGNSFNDFLSRFFPEPQPAVSLSCLSLALSPEV